VIAAFTPGTGALSVPGRLSGQGSAAIVADGGERFFVADAVSLVVDGKTLLRTASPVTLARRRDGRVDVHASEATEITLLRRSPEASTTLSVPAGRSRVVLG
jgi:hypothetical protein